MYIDTAITCNRRHDLETIELELMWMEIKLIPRSILIGVCYRPPGMRQEQANIFVDELQISISQVLAQETDGIYLLGDFNDRCTSWEGPHPNSELKENLS